MVMQRMLTVEDICRKLKPLFGAKIDRLYFDYISSEGREAKEEVATMLHALYEKHFDTLLDAQALLTPPTHADVVAGDYVLGDVLYGKNRIFPFALRTSDMPRHVCMSGMSGSGKTTAAFTLLEGLTRDHKPFLVFDWKKSFRPLMHNDPALTCFTVGNANVANNFKLNINEPPAGISPREWITVLCDLLAESFFVSYGVHKILLETLDLAFKEWGVYSGSGNYPTWHHIKWQLEQRLEGSKSREAGWIESALRVATVLTFGDFGSVVNYKGASRVRIEDILNTRVIFELNALGSIEKKFFCEFVLMYLYKLKKAQQHTSTQGFEYAILVDEAHNIFLKDKTNFAQESVTDMVYREMREYGVSLICLDQHISKLSDTVAGNSACHIAFQQQLPEDIDAISRLMQLTDQKAIFSNLSIGNGVVKLSDRYTQPFFIQTPNNATRLHEVRDEVLTMRARDFLHKQAIPKDSTFMAQETPVQTNTDSFDINTLFRNIRLPPTLNLHATREKSIPTPLNEELTSTIKATIARRLTQGEALETIARTLSDLYGREAVMPLITSWHTHMTPSQPSEQTPKPESVLNADNQKAYKVSFSSSNEWQLPQEARQFLAFLETHPHHELTTVNLYRELGLSPRKGNKTKDVLLAQRLIRVEEIRDEKGWKKFIRLAH